MRNFVLTSTSVTDGHPDKLCDRISDAVVDAYLARDPSARVSAECAVASGIVFLAAHTQSSGHVDIPAIVRTIVTETGYRDPEFNAETVTVLSSTPPSPPHPGGGTDRDPARPRSVNATLFGYACRHTDEMLPLSIALAHRLGRRMCDLRGSGELPMLHPDGQAQVAVRYVNRQPVAIEGVTLSSAVRAQARAKFDLARELRERVIDPVLAECGIAVSPDAQMIVNPEGERTAGGPTRHAGLTGRKNDIDTYGGYSRHGGSALSGKDPSRIDRTGAYAARFAAKTVVAARLAEECEVQISYALGRTSPVSVEIDTFGSAHHPEERIADALRAVIDFDARAILERFKLAERPQANGGRFFSDLGAFGHFGRPELDLPWESTELADEINRLVR